MTTTLFGIGIGLSAFGSLKSASDTKSTARENARLQRMVATRKATVYRRNLRKLLSSQRALYLKAGVDISSGSPAVVMAATAAEGEEEARYIKQTGETTAGMFERQGQSASTATLIQGGATVLSGLYNFFK